MNLKQKMFWIVYIFGRIWCKKIHFGKVKVCLNAHFMRCLLFAPVVYLYLKKFKVFSFWIFFCIWLQLDKDGSSKAIRERTADEIKLENLKRLWNVKLSSFVSACLISTSRNNFLLHLCFTMFATMKI